MTAEPDVQARVLAVYTMLGALRTDGSRGQEPDWAGSLVLGLSLGPSGAALAMAANLAGAVSLAVDPDPALCRAALRSGACDFAVNSLDEAVRVMKNEIRKKAPLSVALEAPFEPTMAEIVERGIRPDLFANISGAENAAPTGQLWLADATQVFSQQGSMILDFSESTEANAAPATGGPAIRGPAILDQHLLARGLAAYEFPFADVKGLRTFDAHTAELLAGDTMRHRWAVGAPRVFYRERPYRRLLYLTRHEYESLVSLAST